MVDVRQRVAVAMSGGVDSSVAAALLREQGHEMFGLMLRLWNEPSQNGKRHNRCCTPDAVNRAEKVAAMLDIPFYVLDARKVFHQSVVQFFLDGYAAGVTPNPCLECNRHIRWGYLLSKALGMGATHLASGHYARVRKQGEKYQLRRGQDTQKDQSYALSMLGQRELSRTIFPIGALTKMETRSLARQFKLPVTDYPESQDLCFLANNNYRDFVRRHSPESLNPGPIVNRDGNCIGQHSGLPLYTIGQRKGIGISSREPLYVLDKDCSSNNLVVGSRTELGSYRLRAGDVNWTSGNPPSTALRALEQIRYGSRPSPARLTPVGTDTVDVEFDLEMRDITPGQAAVFYQGDVCIGGGEIQA